MIKKYSLRMISLWEGKNRYRAHFELDKFMNTVKRVWDVMQIVE